MRTARRELLPRVGTRVPVELELRGVKDLALTAYSYDKSRQKAREVCFDCYYEKPLLPDALANLFGNPSTREPRRGAMALTIR